MQLTTTNDRLSARSMLTHLRQNSTKVVREGLTHLRDVWDAVLIGAYIGYLGKAYSSSCAPISKYTFFSLTLNCAWRIGLIKSRVVIAAASTIAITLLFAFWTILIICGTDGIYENLNANSTFDHFDDVMLHFIFPVEAVLIAAVEKRVYVDNLASFSALILLSLLYVPFFVGYRPYPFIRHSSASVVFWVVFGMLTGTFVIHAFLLRSGYIINVCLTRDGNIDYLDGDKINGKPFIETQTHKHTNTQTHKHINTKTRKHGNT